MCERAERVGANSKLIMESLERVQGQGGVMNRVSDYVSGKASDLRVGDFQGPDPIKEQLEGILESLKVGVNPGLRQFYEDQLVQKYVLQVIESVQAKLKLNPNAKLADIPGLLDAI